MALAAFCDERDCLPRKIRSCAEHAYRKIRPRIAYDKVNGMGERILEYEVEQVVGDGCIPSCRNVV